MNLKSEIVNQTGHSGELSLSERALASCSLAKQLEKSGEYEAACEALIEFWPERTKPPKLDRLEDTIKAELFLRIGGLAGWLGSTDQTNGSQDFAKNLITRSLEIFEKLADLKRIAEVHSDLALCYYREGSFDEARIHLATALTCLQGHTGDLKAVVLIRAGEVEVAAGRLNEALRCYSEAGRVLDGSDDHTLKGSFHSEFARLFRKFGRAESIDRALIEYSAASFHFEQAGNLRYLARVENNLGFLFFTIDKYQEAHKHLDKARHHFLELNDVGAIARVDDTRSRTLLAEGRLQEAERFARSAVRTLEKGDEQALLAEALTTHGVALARLGNHSPAKALLQKAIEVAQTTGDLEGAGRAKLSIIEELAGQTSAGELASIYQSAADLLQHSQDPSTNKRLIICAGKVIKSLGSIEPEDHKIEENGWDGFSFRKRLREYEKSLIERALKDAGGSVTKASRLLGFRHHQSLISLINTRHTDLLKIRSVVQRRRHHLFSEPKRSNKAAVAKTKTITILHADEDPRVANLLHELCVEQNWKVDPCPNGSDAFERLSGKDRFDLIIVDNDLSGVSGLELVLRVRSLPQRRRTPIIMLSSSECETEAWRAGVDAFLRKPRDIAQVPSNIARLLHVPLKKK